MTESIASLPHIYWNIFFPDKQGTFKYSNETSFFVFCIDCSCNFRTFDVICDILIDAAKIPYSKNSLVFECPENNEYSNSIQKSANIEFLT